MKKMKKMKKIGTTKKIKPPRQFRIGQLVSVPLMKLADGGRTTNGYIVGYEWGEEHKDYRSPIWLYRVSPGEGEQTYLYPESKVGQIT